MNQLQFFPEDGDRRFARNVGTQAPEYVAAYTNTAF